jgi:hypothetical protein
VYLFFVEPFGIFILEDNLLKDRECLLALSMFFSVLSRDLSRLKFYLWVMVELPQIMELLVKKEFREIPSVGEVTISFGTSRADASFHSLFWGWSFKNKKGEEINKNLSGTI